MKRNRMLNRKDKGMVRMLMALLVAWLIICCFVAKPAFASEDDHPTPWEFRESTNAGEVAERWNGDVRERYVNGNDLGMVGNYHLELTDYGWIVTNGKDLIMYDVDVVTIYNPDTELIGYYMDLDQWAYLALFRQLVIQQTYNLDEYRLHGWLRLENYHTEFWRLGEVA